jgi:RecA/RadA recombinase
MGVLDKIRSGKEYKQNRYVKSEVEYISTGCYVLNILFSGELFGGIVKKKLMQIVAPSSLGKSFVAMKVAKSAQRDGMSVLLVDTEFAYDETFAQKVGIDFDRFDVIQSNKIEEVQKMVIGALESLEQEDKDQLLVIIDSWGGLVTSKTVEDAVSGKDVTDMTIAKKKNSFAKLLTGQRTTVFVVNQTYETMDMYNPLAVGGGKGLYYACSSIVMGTSKAKDKSSSSGEQTGSIISATTKKGRFCIENSKLKFLIENEGGIHPYYGLLEDLQEGGYVTKPNQGFYVRECVENDKKWRESAIWDNATEFFKPIFETTDFEEFIRNKYRFTGNITDVDEEAQMMLDSLDESNGLNDDEEVAQLMRLDREDVES